MIDDRFKARHCPYCSSDRSKVLISLDGPAIFSANWSYRADRIDSLGLSEATSFPIVECLECAFVYAALLPSAGFLHMVYDEVIDDATARRNSYGVDSVAYRMGYVSKLLQLLDIGSENRSVLDFGCGFGPTLKLLAGVNSLTPVGFDTSKLRTAELVAKGFGMCADLEDVGRRAPFDAVILDNVLEHVSDPRDLLALVRTWCADRALLFVSVPQAGAALINGQRLVQQGGGQPSMEINPWEHLNYFDLEHLDGLLAGAGFLPLEQAQLPGAVEIGLRPEPAPLIRLRNAAASMARLLRYAWSGNALSTVNCRFYRRVPN